MNGHNIQKEYGNHKYENSPRNSECMNGCGCRMSAYQSWGPLGIDPFGKCPGNPKDGKLLGGDYEYVVRQRIDNLESELREAERQLEAVSPDKVNLAKELFLTKKKLYKKEKALREIHDLSKSTK